MYDVHVSSVVDFRTNVLYLLLYDKNILSSLYDPRGVVLVQRMHSSCVS